jgi:hypothetical protein
MKRSPWPAGPFFCFLILLLFSPKQFVAAAPFQSGDDSCKPIALCKSDTTQSDPSAAWFEKLGVGLHLNDFKLASNNTPAAGLNPADAVNANLSTAGPSKIAGLNTTDVDMVFSLAAGYRVDQLDWNIAGYLDGDYWNVLSELTWKDLEIYQVELSNKTVISKNIYLRGAISKGEIFNGQNQDSDYNGNNRTNEWLRSNNATDDGTVFDFSLGAGYQFNLMNQKLHIAPLLGYSHHEQELRISDGNTTISVKPPGKRIDPPPLGPFDGLDSTYKARWNGPWIGLDMSYDWDRKIAWYSNNHLALSIEQHWADYSATADWNLIERFAHPKSFSHHADGRGVVLNVGWILDFTQRWSMNLSYDYQRWTTDPGTDRTYFSWGEVGETRLNEVNWESTALMLGVGCRF